MPDITNLELVTPEDSFGLILHTGVAGALPADNATPRKFYQGDGTELPIAITAGALWIGGSRAVVFSDGATSPVPEKFVKWADGLLVSGFTSPAAANGFYEQTGEETWTAENGYSVALDDGVYYLRKSGTTYAYDNYGSGLPWDRGWVPEAPAAGSISVAQCQKAVGGKALATSPGVLAVTSRPDGVPDLFVAPTTDPQIVGAVWNNNGTLALSIGPD